MKPDTLGVIGLGAIGGSVAWQAAQSGIRRVVGYSPVGGEAVAAAKAGAITDVATTVREVADRADLLVIAAPPGATLAQLRSVAGAVRGRGTLCTDVSSVKAPVVRLAEELGIGHRFAGSHPLAGTHRMGFAAARLDLLTNAIVYVTPAREGEEAAREIVDFWSGVYGAGPVLIDAAAHDGLVAWTSHLPQATASALAAAFARAGPTGVTYGSGARDTTRLAASSTEMWRDILMLNREGVLRALDGLEDQLGELRQALCTGDGTALIDWLEAGAAWRRRLDE
jgi:prephenate dehydrogenase